jgi:pimeloyl-ACP methyl ester carboxylesterase
VDQPFQNYDRQAPGGAAILPFPVPDQLFPVEHRFADLDGTRIHHVDEGAGEPLLFLPGNRTWSCLDRKIIVKLPDEFRCIALDFPGYGMSAVPLGYAFTPAEHSAVLERSIDELGLRNLTFIVQHWGGPIGLGLAARRPGLAERLIIGNTFAWPLRELRVRLFSAALGGPPGRLLTRLFNLAPAHQPRTLALAPGPCLRTAASSFTNRYSKTARPFKRMLTAAAVLSQHKCKHILAQAIACVQSGMPWLGAQPGGVSDVPFRGPDHRQVSCRCRARCGVW